MLISMNVPYRMVRDNIRRIVALEVGTEIYFDNDIVEEVGLHEVKETARMLSDAGIISTVHAPFMDLSPGGADRMVRKTTKEKLMKSVEIGNLLNARGVVCHGGYNKWFFDSRQQLWLEASIDTWKDVLKEAGDALPVMVENIFEENPSPLLELFDYFKGRNFYLCFDSGHFNLFSQVSVDDWLLPFEKRIKEMHLHDNHGQWDEHLPIGMGTFPFPDLKAILQRLGNDIIFTAEIHSEMHAHEGIKRLKEFLS